MPRLPHQILSANAYTGASWAAAEAAPVQFTTTSLPVDEVEIVFDSDPANQVRIGYQTIDDLVTPPTIFTPVFGQVLLHLHVSNMNQIWYAYSNAGFPGTGDNVIVIPIIDKHIKTY